MDKLIALAGIAIAAVFSQNIVLNRTIGICPFLGVSKKTSSAVGMGLAVTFVIALSSVLSYVLYNYVLLPLHLEYLKIILFILVIASLVQLLEIVIKRFSPSLYQAMGIYLPLITTNCAVLATAQDVAANYTGAYGLVETLVFSVFIGVGFLLALVLMASVREKVARADVPKAFRGFPIALLAAGLIAMAFMGLNGLNFFG